MRKKAWAMATSDSTISKPSLVVQFDEIVTATDILTAGMEGGINSDV